VSNEQNLELVRRFNQVFRADDDLTVLDEILAPDFVAHNGDEEVHGPDGWRQFVLEARRMGGNIETGIDELIGDGSLVAERWWLRSSADGAEAFDGHGITIHRIADGKLQENWAVAEAEG
jgi:predicted SnoaL-like aldol condensation-catalyzing enzyme